MKHSVCLRIAFLLPATVAALVMSQPALANPIVPFTLAFEREGLDLDSGTLVSIELWTEAVNPADPQPDLVLGYNSERAVCAVVFHNRMNGVQIAFLDGVAFNMVDSSDLAAMRFRSAAIDAPFEPGDSIVLRTDTGAAYLLGNPIEDSTGVTFDTLLLHETTAGLVRPEGTTLASGSVPRNEALHSASAPLPSELSTEDLRQIRALIEEDGYRIQPASEQPGAITTRNAAHGLRATVVNEDAKLTASDAAADDRFGISVALSGDTAVVGAERDEHSGLGIPGSAYVFVRSGTSWSEQAKLTASDAAPGDLLGGSVALSGNTAVVGAAWDDDDSPFLQNSGSVYVFVGSGTSWSEQAKLTASDATAGDFFGGSVALSGDTAVVGVWRNDNAGGTNAGAAYVFLRSGTTWSEQAKLTASDATAGDAFGESVAISGDTAVVGASGNDHTGGTSAGAAYIFLRSGTTWSEQAKLTASDATAGDVFGGSVALSDDTAVVGAVGDDGAGGTNAGSAYVFTRSGTIWTEQAKLTASDAANDDLFGASVALSGDTAAVAANPTFVQDVGSAYVFVRSGTSWFEQAKLTASDAAAGDRFGVSVALSGDTAVVGADRDDHAGGTNGGSAYVFEFKPPVALCTDVTVSVGSDCTGTADASIDAGSFDPEGDPVTLSQDPPGPYGLGNTLVTLTVTNDNGYPGYCVATVTVTETTAPQLSIVLTPDTLWPPNHHMVDVEATVVAIDHCGTPTVALASLTSNEPDNAPGKDDGETTGDIQLGADDFHFSLRAERAATGSGRIYTGVYTATDGSGNATSKTGFIVVPHDQSGVIDPVAIVLEQSASGTVVSWAVVPDAQSYDVIRGELNNVVETGVEINLGTVVCIEANSTDENTLGWEDGELPDPGQAFFYLVEFYNGISSTYGTESAAYPRVPGLGDCQ